MITTQTADNALKSYYLDVIGETLDKSANPFLAAIKKTTSDVWGRDVRKTVRVGFNGGVGAGTEDGALPAASGNSYAQLVSTLKNLYGSIEITDKAIRASQSNEGAFVNLLNDEMDGLVKSASFNFGRMLFGDGTGKLATVTKEGGADAAEFDTLQNLSEGMTVDVYDSGDSSQETGLIIKTIDRAAKKITFSKAHTFSAGDYLVMQNSKGLEITGLKAIFAKEGKLYGLDKKENSWLVPTVIESEGTLTEADVQKAIDSVEESYGGKINMILCSMGVRRAMLKDLTQYRRFEPMNFEGGFATFGYGGVPVVADRFCPAGTAYLINTEDFALHQLCDWQWLEGEDGKILKQIAGKPVYTATLVKYAELMCYRPCGQAMITGITEA